MIKLQISYETEEEKTRMIEIVSAGTTINYISKPHKSGQYYRLYLDIK